jgi:integrase
MDTATVSALAEHRRRQLKDQLVWGEAWKSTGLVFTREDGSSLHPDLMTRRFERLARRAGLPPIRLHDLRHGAATLALAAGVDMKVISVMLGHSSISITADTYTSVLPQLGHPAAEAAAALVPRAANSR